MDTFISTIALFAFVSVYLLLGVISSRWVKSTGDFFLAGRGLGLAAVSFSLLATQLGSGMLIGAFDDAYVNGLMSLAYPLGIATGFLILGLGVASRLRSLNVATTAEIFEKYYHSPRLKQLASLLSIATLCGLLVAQMVASRGVIDSLSGGNYFVFTLFWVVIITHTMMGGLAAVAVTDTVQALFIMIVFTGVFGYIFNHDPVPFFRPESLANLQATYFPHATWQQFLPIYLMPALFSLIEQDLAQHFFAAKTERIARKAALFACLMLLAFACIPTYFGIKAYLLGITGTGSDFPLFNFIGMLTNEFVVLLVACGLIAAITSTADTLLCAVSSNVAQDFELSWTGIKNSLTRSKVVTLCIGFGAFAASHVVPQQIIRILVESYALSVCGLLIPLLAVYWGKPAGTRTAALSVAAGLISFGICTWFLPSPARELLPLALSLVVYLAGMAFEQNK